MQLITSKNYDAISQSSPVQSSPVQSSPVQSSPVQSSPRAIIPYAFIRVYNEQRTIKLCLESIVANGMISKGLIIMHEPLPNCKADRTEDIVRDFVAKNPGFKFIKYPYPVLGANSRIYFSDQITDLDPAWMISNYYQFALNEIRKLAKENGDYDQAWLFKVDGDHIYSSKSLRMMLDYAANDEKQRKGYFVAKFNVMYVPPTNKVHALCLVQNGDHYLYKMSLYPDFCLKIINGNEAYETVDIDNDLETSYLFNTINYDFGFLNSIHFQTESRQYHRESWSKIAEIYKTDPPINGESEFSYHELIRHGFLNPNICFDYEIMNDTDKMKLIVDRGYGIELFADKEFFSVENIRNLFTQFDYTTAPSLEYLNDHADIDELINNPKYRSNASYKIFTPIYEIEGSTLIRTYRYEEGSYRAIEPSEISEEPAKKKSLRRKLKDFFKSKFRK